MNEETTTSEAPKLVRRTAVVELASGSVVTARIINPDTLRYEETAQRLGWPSAVVVIDGNAEVRGNALRDTFEAYAALKRTGQYDGTWDDFRGRDCVDVTVDEKPVDPTRPAPVPDSSPSSHGTDAGPSMSSSEPLTS